MAESSTSPTAESYRQTDTAGQGATEPTTARDVSDAELERGILDAIRMGLADVARTLSTQLDERRRGRVPANVVELAARRRP